MTHKLQTVNHINVFVILPIQRLLGLLPLFAKLLMVQFVTQRLTKMTILKYFVYNTYVTLAL